MQLAVRSHRAPPAGLPPLRALSNPVVLQHPARQMGRWCCSPHRPQLLLSHLRLLLLLLLFQLLLLLLLQLLLLFHLLLLLLLLLFPLLLLLLVLLRLPLPILKPQLSKVSCQDVCCSCTGGITSFGILAFTLRCGYGCSRNASCHQSCCCCS